MKTKCATEKMSLYDFARHCAGLTIEKISIHTDNGKNGIYFDPLSIELRFSEIICSCILPQVQCLSLKSDAGIVTFPNVDSVTIGDRGFYEIATVLCKAEDGAREYTLLIDYATKS